MNFRRAILQVGTGLVFLLYMITDPDTGIVQNLPIGASTLIFIMSILAGIWFIALLHVGRKALFDYVDLSSYFNKAKETASGSGLAIIGIGLAMIAISIVILAATLSSR